MDCVRDIGGARLATDREREWEPESGEAVRGRYGMPVVVDQEGEIGERGLGSVLLRRVGGFLRLSKSSGEGKLGFVRRREGTGEGLNSSIRSVSGTGSIANCGDAARHV